MTGKVTNKTSLTVPEPHAGPLGAEVGSTLGSPLFSTNHPAYPRDVFAPHPWLAVLVDGRLPARPNPQIMLGGGWKVRRLDPFDQVRQRL